MGGSASIQNEPQSIKVGGPYPPAINAYDESPDSVSPAPPGSVHASTQPKQMCEVQTSMSDFTSALLDSLPVVVPPPAREVPMCTQEVQTEPWEPDMAVALADRQDIQVPKHYADTKSAPPPGPVSVEDVWVQVTDTLDVPKGSLNPYSNLVVKRSGWKTVRVFVSSTFKDFHYEREVLVKEVFPDLRAWCEQKRLHLVECDLRWGVPKDSTSELTLKTCLGEIDRCYQDNIMPFFLNLTSERIGWIPIESDVPGSFVEEYKWIFGLSMTEMEIVHGAYRKDNPNSLFLMREGSFLENVPQQYREQFVDENKLAPHKLKILKQMIADRFPPERIVNYSSTYDSVDSSTNKLRFKVSENFRKSVFEFFKQRIEQQYPLYDEEQDPMERSREAHEAFMKSRGESVLGRQEILSQINDYVVGKDNDVPFLILGQPGTGKSSIMAKVADDTSTMAMERKIPGGADQGWHIFHHFVGAVPGSTDLYAMLCRLLKEVKAIDDSSMPTDMDTAVGLAIGALNNPTTRPVIIFIDALNQLNEDGPALQCNWVPRKLPSNIRCVFSMINGSAQHENLMARESKPRELFVSPLSLSVRKDMVTEFLGKFNKKLDMDQMFGLLSKRASENPLWLSIACEELRVFGNFREVSDKINTLPDGLLDLLTSVLTRFEQEAGGGHLLTATLCLIEVSSFGLLESELLVILADEDNLLPPEGAIEKGEKEQSEKKMKKNSQQKNSAPPQDKLPAMKWAAVYRSLRPFLRPFGDSGEGRLDFYHRTLSKVVRKKYLKAKIQDADTLSLHPSAMTHATSGEDGEAEDLSPTYKWWHTKLADFFQMSENFDRKIEEYPYHLLKLKDTQRLKEFLCDWRTIDRLYDVDYSGKLLKYWKPCGGFDGMVSAYHEILQQLSKDGVTDKNVCRRYVQIGRIIAQGGQYDQGLGLAQQALKYGEENLTDDGEKMADIYDLLGYIWDQKTKLHEFCSRDQIPEVRECMKYQEKTIEILRQLGTAKKIQQKLAKLLIGRAFSLASFSDCGGDEEMSNQQALEAGDKDVDIAITMLKQMKDNGRLAEALMTKAVLCRYSRSMQEKLYNEAEEICQQTYGTYHPLMGRINLNTGICYEDAGQYHKSYDYFRRNLDIALEVYGKEHIRTQRSLNILNEPMYRRIATQRGQAIPEL